MLIEIRNMKNEMKRNIEMKNKNWIGLGKKTKLCQLISRLSCIFALLCAQY